MSRGLGKLQQRMLAELEHGHASVMDLCEKIFGEWPVSDSHYSAGRRAMRGLVRRGLAVQLPMRYRVTWTSGPPSAQKHFAVPEEAERERRRVAQWYRERAEQIEG